MGPEAQSVSDQDNKNITNVSSWRRCRATVQEAKRTLQPRSSKAKRRQKACAQWLAWSSNSWLVATRHVFSPMMMKVQPLPVPLPPVPQWQRCRRQRRSMTPLPLLPRLWTQVTSPSGMCSMSLPFPCLPKSPSRLQTTSGHGALFMLYSSFASCPQSWRLRFRSRLKHSMRGSKNFISILRQPRIQVAQLSVSRSQCIQ